MIRAFMGNQAYWDSRKGFTEKAVAKRWLLIQQPTINPIYDPQYTFDTGIKHIRVLLISYSRGDAIPELVQYFDGLLDAWELSNRLAEDICREHQLDSCRDWTFELSNLNHYNWCFWLVGLALALDLAEPQWQRLLALVGGAGEDVLLDRIIARREPKRDIGKTLLHPKPYARLLAAIDAPTEQQAALLLEFVDHWYPELYRKGHDELWWYLSGELLKNPFEKGVYYGFWCIEAVAAVKAFGLDDSLCLGHDHYPGDLLRPDGPSTHPLRPELEQAAETSAEPQPKRSFWRWLLGG